MKSLSRLFLVALLTTLATGCVYVNGDKINTDDWKDTQVTNREAISQLDMGLSTQAVKDQLGAPADSEAFMDDGEEVRVLFYRTNHKHSDGETTRDETTPLVFRNDQLVGLGDSGLRIPALTGRSSCQYQSRGHCTGLAPEGPPGHSPAPHPGSALVRDF